MSGRHHILLIGIDAYDGGGSLSGCVNDIDAVQRFLVDHVGVDRTHIRRLASPRTGTDHETDVSEELPLLDTMRAELERLGTDAVGPDDRVFIYYSGHGTQCTVKDGDGRLFAREALVPRDKKVGVKYRLLYDWELNTLIARIAARTSAVTVVLDCCNSGGATRGLDEFEEAEGTDRFLPIPDVVPLTEGTDLSAGSVRGVASALGSLQHCQVIAACRDDQRARESEGKAGKPQGELTRALVTQLSAVPAADLQDLRWGRIWRGVEKAVRDANPRQSPWLSGRFGRRVFGFGPDDDVDPGYAVEQTPDGYRVDAGALVGVTEDAEVGVYGVDPPAFPPLGSAEDLAARKGTIRVVRVDRASSEAVAVAPFVLPEAPRGRLVRAGRDARLRVALAPDDADLAERLEASTLIELVQPEQAELTLKRLANEGGWFLVDDVHGTGENADEPVLAVIPAAHRLDMARPAVEHYYAYSAPLRLARACTDLPKLLRVWLLDCNGATLTAEEAQNPDLPQVQPGVHAPYEIKAGDHICIVVANDAEVTLSVALFDCAASGKVQLLGEKRVGARSKHVFWLGETLGKPFVASLPPDVRVGVDRIAAIATTRKDVSLRFLESSQTFAKILTPPTRGGPGLRDMDDEDLQDRGGAEEPPAESWTFALTALRIVRPD